MNLRATVASRNAQIAMLEADLQARQQREASLNARLAEALASTDPHVPRLRAEIVARDEQIAQLKADLDRRARTPPRKTRISRSPKKASAISRSRCATRPASSRKPMSRSRNGAPSSPRVSARSCSVTGASSSSSPIWRSARRRCRFSAAQTGEEIALEGPARVLIRTDGNTDFVHVLGRRTRIGRGPDNELVLDTKHISRYHAVLLAGPVHTTIEDLNSTNGVFVNGKRVSRQASEGWRPGDRRPHAVPLLGPRLR